VGGPQYRVGSHRQFVGLARVLAAAGCATVRFDYRGMGDSAGQPRDFQSIDDDIACVLDNAQQQLPAVRRWVLWGLCDGASAALMYCARRRDARVAGLCLANPWVRSDVTIARTHVKHYYLARLRQPSFWAKVLSGQVAGQALADLARNVGRALRRRGDRSMPGAAPAFQETMAAGWKRFDGQMLLLLSERDYTAKEFSESLSSAPAWADALRHPHLQLERVVHADHTFATPDARLHSEALTLHWLRDRMGARLRPPEPLLALDGGSSS
jgi:uncharacterized protein